MKGLTVPKKLALLLILTSTVLALVFSSIALAQVSWGSDQLIEDNAGDEGNVPQVAISGSYAVAVWSQYDGGAYRIYSNYSTDGGATWDSDQLIEDNAGYDGYRPQVAISGSDAVAVWVQYDDSGYWRIYSNYSTDGGATWGSDQLIEDNAGYSKGFCQVAIFGSNVVAVWDEDDGSTTRIYSNYSTDGGAIWGKDQLIEDNTGYYGEDPQVAIYGSNVVAVWQQNDDSTTRIYSNYSTDGGATWGSEQLIEDNAGNIQQDPEVAIWGSDVVAVWFAIGDNRIYSNYSTDGGATWGSDQLIDTGPNGCWPQVAISGSKAVAVWSAHVGTGASRIYSNYSTDGGATWDSDQLIEDNSGYSGQDPQVAISGSDVVAVWHQYDGSNQRIYSNYSIDGGATWGSDQLIEDNAGYSGNAPQVAISGSNVVAVWSQYNGSGAYRIYSNYSTNSGTVSPDISVSPTSFEITLPPDTIQDYTLTIRNDGSANLDYSISDWTTGEVSEAVDKNLLVELQPASAVLGIPLERDVVEPEQTGASGWQTIMTEDFESSFPTGLWVAVDNDGATNGEYYWDEDDYRQHSGSCSAWCAKGGTDGLDPQFSDYANYMQSWMIYGPFDLSDATDAELNFYYWLDSEEYYDNFKWLASTNGINFYGSRLSGWSSDWQYESFDLTIVPTLGNLCGETQVWIAFIFQSDQTVVDKGAFVDDIELRKMVSAEHCAWLDESPKSGTVSTSASHNVNVSIDTTGLGSDYCAEIHIDSNDPDESRIRVPVTLHVIEEEPPDISVFPTSFNITLPANATANYTLTINNDGDTDLAYSISDGETTSVGSSTVSKTQIFPARTSEQESPLTNLQRLSNPYLVKTFLDEEGREIAEVVFPGRPPEIKAPIASVPCANQDMGTNSLANVPAFNWSYGCSATSAAMMMGYYDNTGYPDMYLGPTNGGVCPMDNTVWGQTLWPSGWYSECPLSATHQGIDGRPTSGHVDDYWVDYGDPGPDPFMGNWPEHAHGDCTGDYVGTNQCSFNNTDGATTFYFYTSGAPLYDYTGCEPARRDGCHGMRLFAESRGYTVRTNFTQLIMGRGTVPDLGFTFDDFKAEIDAGRPVIIHVEGHSMLGYGYNDPDTVYLHDTWDHGSHSMTWGGTYGTLSSLQHYAVTVIWIAPDCPWLSAIPTSGSIGPAGSHDIAVGIDTTDLGSSYTAEITITSNDPNKNRVVVPINLQVTQPLISCNITLATGWNLISLPLIPDNTDINNIICAANLASANPSNISLVYSFNTSSGQWMYWNGTGASTIHSIVDGRGYWFYADAADILTLYGTAAGHPGPDYDVLSGCNQIGFTSTTAMAPETYLTTVIADCGLLYQWTGTGWNWWMNGNPSNSLTNMAPGYGYWLYMNSDGIITPP